MSWLERLMDSPIAWGILSTFAVAGFLYAIICQHVNTERKEFSYCHDSYPLIRKKKTVFEKLSIEYDGKSISDLTVSYFTIWNSGNRTLNCSDIVETKELTISAEEESLILDAEIITTTEDTNKFSLEKIDDRTLKIGFDYAEKKDGLVLQVIHTGSGDSIKIGCKIKGGKPLKMHVNDKLPDLIRKAVTKTSRVKFMVVLAVAMIALLLLSAIVYTVAIFNTELQTLLYQINESKPIETAKDMVTQMACMLWGTGLFLVFLYIPLIKKMFNLGVPKALR